MASPDAYIDLSPQGSGLNFKTNQQIVRFNHPWRTLCIIFLHTDSLINVHQYEYASIQITMMLSNYRMGCMIG